MSVLKNLANVEENTREECVVYWLYLVELVGEKEAQSRFCKNMKRMAAEKDWVALSRSLSFDCYCAAQTEEQAKAEYASEIAAENAWLVHAEYDWESQEDLRRAG